jgi:hypothetical protein
MEPNTEQSQAFMDFLNDGLLFGAGELLDASTLAAVCAVESQRSPQARKRSRASDEPPVKREDEEDEEEEDSTEGDGKRKKPDLAKNKACREKARRGKLNDRCGPCAGSGIGARCPPGVAVPRTCPPRRTPRPRQPYC